VLLPVAAFVLPSPGLAAPKPAWVNPEILNVRASASTTSTRIGSLPRGAKVYVVETRGDWCKVSYGGGKRGWVGKWLLEFSPKHGAKLAGEARTESAKSAHAQAWVSASRVNVRAAPNTRAKQVAQLDKGAPVRTIKRSGNWSCVTLSTARTGWIRSDLLTTKAPKNVVAAVAAKPQPQLPKGYVNANDVNVRTGPGSRFPRSAVLPKGTAVWVLETKDSWQKVKYGNGHGGWVASSFIKPADAPVAVTAAPESGASSVGDDPTEAIDGLYAWIAEDEVKARFGPGMEFDVKSGLERGAKVAVMDIDGHWCKVRLPVASTYGWVPGWTLSFAGPGASVLAPAGDKTVQVHVGWVAKDDVNLRGDPEPNAPVIASLTANTQIVILDKRADWYKVALSTNQIGWVAARLVDTREQRLAVGNTSRRPAPLIAVAQARRGSLEPASLGGRLVRTAMSYLGRGIRYRYGGSSVSGGFDCSGFIQFVLQQHGREVPRRASHQYLCGKHVDRSQLLPGDLVFFRDTYKKGISHVGLYIGAGRFIHSSSAAGGIAISSLSESFYNRKYAGGQRIY
jgi:cell wall-associated NlpC family hydrolase